jgi:muramoyltetrapeptide carboxypeptidase
MRLVELVFPEPLAPGDRVAVVAPSSPFPRLELLRGLAWVRDRYEVVARSSLFDRAGFLAGSDESRARALADAMLDPRVKAILAARGGYGATRIVERLPWEAFRRAPKWIVGFSDVTALHVEAWVRGVASIHGPNVTGLAPLDVRARAAWLRAVERPRAEVTWTGLRVVREGRAAGPAFGGNLALLEAMAAAGRLPPLDGAVLFVEDVTERPYRVDRMMTALRASGRLARIAGVVLGEFDKCEPGADGVTVDAVLAERTRDLGVPVVAGAPFGHGARNDALVLGARARIDGGRVVLGAARAA